jgi:hypothetical protein
MAARSRLMAYSDKGWVAYRPTPEDAPVTITVGKSVLSIGLLR